MGIKDINFDIASSVHFPVIGGIAGFGGTWNDFSSVPKIYNCFITGKMHISGYANGIGGIIGDNFSVEVKDCYTDISINAEEQLKYEEMDIGGIIGQTRGPNCINCYALGVIKNGKMICDGRYYTNAIPENCYYLTSSGTDEYGHSLTSAQMKMPGSFPSFDFYNTWIIDSASPYPYPQLRSCMQVRPVSMKLTSLPLKQNYSIGERLDMSGASLDVVYEDGTTANIPISEYMVSCDMSLMGSQNAIISYGNCTESFEINIEKYDPNLRIVQEYTKEVGDTFDLEFSTESDGDISFTSKNAGIAAVDANGRVKTLRSGTVEIIVTQAETKWYKADTKTVTIEIGEHSYQTVFTPAGTKTNGSYVKICSKCGAPKGKFVIYAASNIVISPASYTYNGNSRKPLVVVRDSRGTLLKNNVDYTVSYPPKMRDVGRYIAIITLKGDYKGTVKKAFDIIPKRSSISKVKARKKGFTVKWKKQSSQITGYEVQYSANSKFAKKETKTVIVGNSKTISKSVSKLKAKKNYYVRIRTYKTVSVNGKFVKLYSEWSKVKTVKTKR